MNNLIEKYISESKKEEAYKKLEQGIPIQYIIGNVEFLDYKINVDERVLIPRFETELLVDKTIKYAQDIFNSKIKVLDLGTGSGCIAIALANSLNSEVTAVDKSIDALELAKKNAASNNANINFIEHDMSKSIEGKFDLIISNPPYITENGYVEDIVKNNEPNLALFAPDEGLYYYKKILSYAFDILNKPGLIAFEIGDNQQDLLDAYLKQNFTNKYKFEKDLTNRYRYLFIFNE